MLLQWLRTRRRRKLLAELFPSEWTAFLDAIEHYRHLSLAQQARARDLARIIIAEREFEGCGGLEMTDEIRVTVAGLAAILALGFSDYLFENVPAILVYPEGYTAPELKPIGDILLEDEADRLGEAHYRGPVILSWAEVSWDAQHAGQGTNLVFHEFSHPIDMRNGAADGVPVLPRPLRGRWQEVMAKEYKRLCRAADRGRATLIDPYGATDPAEFFAVVTESFFDVPRHLREEHPELYDIFREFYGQDPAERMA